MDLKAVLSLPQYPGEFLHPVVYACTAVMLLCLCASVLTYILHQSEIRISRRARHALLNFCFHTALTFTVFAGGINRTKHPVLCQAVGIALHYSTLSSSLWILVTARDIYKQVNKKAPPCPGADRPDAQQPLLRFYLLSGGVPFIICGVTAATNIGNYGTEDGDAAYCWMAWTPSLGAFYGPAACITLLTCVYFLGTYVQLRRHPERRYELRERTEERQRLAAPECGLGHGAPTTPPACEAPAPSQLQNEHSFRAQLRAAAFTLLLFDATWAFGALAVSQGPFLDMVFSCLYGACCVTLGLFVLIHHCAKREDVWRCWWSCRPARGALRKGPALDANGDALGPAACLQDSPHPGQPRAFGHCKMTNLQTAQAHARCLSPATPCCAKTHCAPAEEEPGLCEDAACAHGPHLHRCLPASAEPLYFGGREYAYHLPSSLDGSPRSSRTDSAPSSLDGPVGAHALACCDQSDPFASVGEPAGGETSPGLYGCALRPGREAALGPAQLELLRRTQSLPFGGPGQNGPLQGDACAALPFGTDGTGNIRTGPWRNETTV
ncbi:adhesion G protein-coupled receptor A1 isoform X2 [Oryctolagus cuniculus]|uniref:adhesion G protein-coupled receptor A1 isoform X2 n=1 Tax=Oryctolagus cuniculus TaxID=9986 RepID=UPI00048F81ED|nr:adhesion G protein-coupled receptor A1 isoform X2 [Oryctolagus cuniculus]